MSMWVSEKWDWVHSCAMHAYEASTGVLVGELAGLNQSSVSGVH